MFRTALAALTLICSVHTAHALDACPSPDLNTQSASQITTALKALNPQELITPPEFECQGGFNVSPVAAKSQQLCMFEGKFPVTAAGLLGIVEHDEATTLVYVRKYSTKQHAQIDQALAKKYHRITAEQYPGKLDHDLPVQASYYLSAHGIYITLMSPSKKVPADSLNYQSVIMYEKPDHVGLFPRFDKECKGTAQ